MARKLNGAILLSLSEFFDNEAARLKAGEGRRLDRDELQTRLAEHDVPLEEFGLDLEVDSDVEIAEKIRMAMLELLTEETRELDQGRAREPGGGLVIDMTFRASRRQ